MNATRITLKTLTAQGRMNWLRKSRLVPALLLVLALGASACIEVPAHAGTFAIAPQPAQPIQPEAGEMNGHVFLCDSQGTVDVTSTLQTVNGQTYATLHSQTFAIYINNGNVFDTNGNSIGYIAKQSQ